MNENPKNNGMNYAQASAFAQAVAGGGGAKAEDVYLWEHGVGVEPWPEPVDGKALLDELARYVSRFVVLARWVADTLALWVLHTYAFPLRDVTTYIGVESPEKRCGKTTLLTVLCDLVNRPVVASNISSPAFYRVIEEKSPTLLIDEADTVLHRNRELRGILNSGYSRQTAYVIRANNRARAGKSGETQKQTAGEAGGEVKNGLPAENGGNGGNGKLEGADGAAADSQLARFSCWCPKVIATIRHLPDVLADRCIVIAMQRKTWQEKSERLRRLNGTELRRKCARFVRDRAKEIAAAQPAMPEDLNDRAADIWEPLVALADLAGGDWPSRAREAAVGLTAIAQEESPIGALLFDLMVIFVREKCAQEKAGISTPKEGGTRVFSRNMVAWLNGAADRPWVVMRKGKEVTELWLAQVLRPYGIKPKTLWIGDQAAKGYLEDDFTEVFRRYIGKAAAAAYVKELHAEKDDGPQGQTEAPAQGS